MKTIFILILFVAGGLASTGGATLYYGGAYGIGNNRCDRL